MKASSLLKIDLTSTATLHYIWLLKMGAKKWWNSFLQEGADIHVLDHWDYSALHRASENGHASVARALLRQGSDIHQTDKWGNTCLHRSSQNGHTSAVELLLRNGANSHAANQSKSIPLHCAAKYGHTKTVQILAVNEGSDIHGKDKLGHTPFHRAAQNGHTQVVECLIRLGSSAIALNHKSSPLILAADGGFLENCRVLIGKVAR